MHRILYEIPIPFTEWAFPIHSYGFMMMIAFVVAIRLAYRRAKRQGIAPEVILDIGLYAVVAGIIGARIAFIITDFRPDSAAEHPLLDMVAIWKGGLTFQGGLFLALVVCLGYLQAHRLRAAVIADLFAPGLALGVALGRLGCFLNGCCWGRICSPHTPTGVMFPRDSGVFQHHLQMLQEQTLLPALAGAGQETLARTLVEIDPFQLPPPPLESIPVHPTQLYTVAALLVVFGILLWVERWPRRVPGVLMATFLMLYSLMRFVVEFWRDDTPLLLAVGSFPGLHLGQYLALLTFVAAGAFIIYRQRSPAAAMEDPA